MYPISLNFNSSLLKEFQIKKISGQADVGELLSELKLYDLVKKAQSVAQKIKYTIEFSNGDQVNQSIDNINDNFLFTILSWAWKIDKELGQDEIITFGVDFNNVKPGQVIKLNDILNIGTAQNLLVAIQIVSLKKKILDYLLIELQSYLQQKGIRNRVIKSLSGDDLVICSAKTYATRASLGLLFFLGIIGFVSCTAGISTSPQPRYSNQVIEDAISICKSVVSDPWNCRREVLE